MPPVAPGHPDTSSMRPRNASNAVIPGTNQVGGNADVGGAGGGTGEGVSDARVHVAGGGVGGGAWDGAFRPSRVRPPTPLEDARELEMVGGEVGGGG